MGDHDPILSQRQRFIVALLVVFVAFCALVVIPFTHNDNGDKLDTLLARSNARTQTFNEIQDAQAQILRVLLQIQAQLANGG